MRIAILGAGESGVGAAILARKLGFEVWLSDYGVIEPSYLEDIVAYEIPYESGGHTMEKILTADEVIKSPGIPFTVDIVQQVLAAGIPVIDEVEFASRYTKAEHIVGITGSNGKTTTTKLVHHILAYAGYDVGLVGNIGYSFARRVAENDAKYYAVELSSFQLDACTTFRPTISVLLNITADHLDRYDYKIEKYIASKFRVKQAQGTDDYFIFNVEDVNTQRYFKESGLQTCKGPTAIGIDMSKQYTEHGLNVRAWSLAKEALPLPGVHNAFNVACALQVAQLLGVKEHVAKEALTAFENESHRMEDVGIWRGVRYINDSKATNVDAVYYALDAMPDSIVWVAGGIDKGNDYTQILALVQQKVHTLICLGKENTRLRAAFEHEVENFEETESVDKCIALCAEYAQEGEVVLLSPACSSFDLFKNYKARGDAFREAVQSKIQNV